MTFLRKKLSYFVLMFSLSLAAIAFAAESPIPVLEATANDVIHSLKAQKATLKTKPQVVYRIIEQKLLPIVDKKAMSRSALGPVAWRSATPEQKERFTVAFTKLLERTYASALANYNNESLQFLPLRGNDYTTAEPGARMIVNSNIIRSNGQPIRLSYWVILENGDGWRLYDMSVEGVSLLQSFRSEFAQELSSGTLEQLIEKLERRNRAAGMD